MADQVVYQTRRTLEESADKLDDSDVDPVKAHLDELEKMVQDDDGKPVDIDAMDDAAIQAKVKEIEEAMHGVSAKLYEAASAEMAEQDGSEDDGNIDVGGDEVVDADFEVVDED
jgi:molecular chaperone DnaK